MDHISQHFCTQDKARQSVWTRIQSYGISLRTSERSSRVHYLSTITIYVLVPLPHFLPLFALLIDWKAQKFLKGCSVRMWRHCTTSDMGSVACAPQHFKILQMWKVVHDTKMFLATEMLRNYNTNVTIMTLQNHFSYTSYFFWGGK